MGIPQNDTTKIAKYEVDGYWQYFKNRNGEYIDIYAPDEAYETYDISGELREGVNELGGTSKLGFIKVVEGFSGNVCNDSYRAWDIENGRIYEVGGRFYQVRGDSEVGGYFFDRGGHDEFGLPVGNEIDGLYDSYQLFSKVIGGEEIRIVDSILRSPHQEPEGEKYCRGEEPICGNGIIEEGEVCDDGNTSDNDQCSSDCRNKCEMDKKWDGNSCVGDGEDAVCGNGVLEAGEVCDDGNRSDGDRCSADCNNECSNEGEVWNTVVNKCVFCPVGYHIDIERGGRCVKDFLNSVHPLAQDPNCRNIDKLYTGHPDANDDFGYRGSPPSFHSGVDIRAFGDPCKVNSVAKGDVIESTTGHFGEYYVDIKHGVSGYVSRYVHGEYSGAEEGLPIKNGAKVDIDTYVFIMGCTGSTCGGRHLHFSLLKNGELVDPQLDEYFGYMGQTFYYEKAGKKFVGNFYNATKIY